MPKTKLSIVGTTQGSCSSCSGTNIVKKGRREKKLEIVQLWYCNDCKKVFTPQSVKGKTYPLAAIIEGMSYYNLGFSLAQACRIVNEKLGLTVPLPKLPVVEAKSPRGQKGTSDAHSTSDNVGSGIHPSSLANWVEEFKDLCRYHRYRPFAVKMYSPYQVVETATLAHRQLYRFMFHRAKTKLIIREDIKHARFGPLADFLALVPSETPHQLFSAEGGQRGSRASESPIKFSKEQMIVRSKHNFANQLAAFVVQTVTDNKKRHEAVQKFMLANDTVTVATEVPVYLKRDDLLHMQTQLGFELYASDVARRRGKSRLPMLQSRQGTDAKPLPKLRSVEATSQKGQRGTGDVLATTGNIGSGAWGHGTTGDGTVHLTSGNIGSGTLNPLRLLTPEKLPRLITGHIDLIQIRNGLIHILDYKPNAAKEKPIEQLTLYAMALSRLTGLRMYCFKCAWFDEKDYFEFFPLHVVYKRKPRGRKRRSDSKKIVTKEGVYALNTSHTTLENMRPMA